MSDLNENIKNFRTFRGINQESLAALLGKTKSVISNWERGANSPDPDSIESLCKYLDVTPNQIFGWESNPEYEEWQKKITQTNGRIKMLKAKINSMNKEIEKLEREQAQLKMTDDTPKASNLDDANYHILQMLKGHSVNIDGDDEDELPFN